MNKKCICVCTAVLSLILISMFSTLLASTQAFAVNRTISNTGTLSPSQKLPIDQNFTEPEILVTSPSTDAQPTLLQDSEDIIWLFFLSNRSGNYQIHYMTLFVNNQTGSQPTLFAPAINTKNTFDPVVFQDSSGRIWVAWRIQNANTGDEIWYSTSNDKENWTQARLLCNGQNDMGGFTEKDGKVWFFFNSLSNGWSASFRTSTDGGESWSTLSTIPATEGTRILYSYVLSNGTILVVYRTGVSHNYAGIGYSYSSDEGQNWESGIVDDPVWPQWDNRARVIEYQNRVIVFFERYCDQSQPQSDIWYKEYSDGQWNEPQQLTDDDAQDDYPWPVIVNDALWVVWGSTRNGDWDIWLSRTVSATISATIEILPSTLNLVSKGKWVTCYIELPEGNDVAYINASTVMLNDTVPAEIGPAAIEDYDEDGVTELMVKFERMAVTEYILENLAIEGRFMNVTLTVSGKLYDGPLFRGSDTIRVIKPVPMHPTILDKLGFYKT